MQILEAGRRSPHGLISFGACCSGEYPDKLGQGGKTPRSNPGGNQGLGADSPPQAPCPQRFISLCWLWIDQRARVDVIGVHLTLAEEERVPEQQQREGGAQLQDCLSRGKVSRAKQSRSPAIEA